MKMEISCLAKNISSLRTVLGLKRPKYLSPQLQAGIPSRRPPAVNPREILRSQSERVGTLRIPGFYASPFFASFDLSRAYTYRATTCERPPMTMWKISPTYLLRKTTDGLDLRGENFSTDQEFVAQLIFRRHKLGNRLPQ